MSKKKFCPIPAKVAALFKLKPGDKCPWCGLIIREVGGDHSRPPSGGS